MFELILSFFAGILTILAPCVLPLLPIILGSSTGTKSFKRPLAIIAGLSLSVAIISLLLLYLSGFATIRTELLTQITGLVLVFLGITYVFPSLWEHISIVLRIQRQSNTLLEKANSDKGVKGSFFTGVALGPVFNSCSPVYFVVVLPLLQKSFGEGILYLVAYIAGLILSLSLVSFFGYSITRKMKFAANPKGRFRRILGILFIVIGIGVFFGVEKRIEAYLLENTEFYYTIQEFERSFID
jgi:cytochrome c biogenesis protein CcdA